MPWFRLVYHPIREFNTLKSREEGHITHPSSFQYLRKGVFQDYSSFGEAADEEPLVGIVLTKRVRRHVCWRDTQSSVVNDPEAYQLLVPPYDEAILQRTRHIVCTESDAIEHVEQRFVDHKKHLISETAKGKFKKRAKDVSLECTEGLLCYHFHDILSVVIEPSIIDSVILGYALCKAIQEKVGDDRDIGFVQQRDSGKGVTELVYEAIETMVMCNEDHVQHYRRLRAMFV